GHESQIGTAHGQQQSRSYNTNIRQQTVRLAMIDQIERAQHGESEFNEVILAHFALKKEDILGIVGAWKADTGINQADFNRLQQLLTSLK
ncbi:MAG: hypothetical protein EZS28_053656, partial [Streblomastix strix]